MNIRSKIHQKSIYISSKSAPGGPPGGILGPLGPQDGRERRFLRQLGANLGPTWEPRWGRNRTKTMSKIDEILRGSRNRFGSILGRSWAPSWVPISTQIEKKSILGAPLMLRCFYGRFFHGFLDPSYDARRQK